MCVCVTMMNGDTTEAEQSNGAETLSHVHQSLCPPSSQSLSFPLGFSSPSPMTHAICTHTHTHTHTSTRTHTHTCIISHDSCHMCTHTHTHTHTLLSFL